MLDKIRSMLMGMTRVLPAVGFGRAAEPPTAPIGRSGQTESADQTAELHEQQHVDVPSRAVGKRPRK
jgi:hypothetical protein